jgi:hypothetical protein
MESEVMASYWTLWIFFSLFSPCMHDERLLLLYSTRAIVMDGRWKVVAFPLLSQSAQKGTRVIYQCQYISALEFIRKHLFFLNRGGSEGPRASLPKRWRYKLQKESKRNMKLQSDPDYLHKGP